MLRVPAVQHRLEVDAVRRRVGDQPRLLEGLGAAAFARADRMHVQGDADLGRAKAAQGLSRQSVPEQQVMGGRRRRIGVAQARGVVAGAIAVVGRDLRLVQRDPAGDPVAKSRRGQRGVFREPLGRAAYRPAALVLEFLGQVPVVKRGGGRDSVLGELVEQPAVVVQAPGVRGSAAAGLDPRPGDREPVRAQSERGHQRHVLTVTVVRVAGDVAGVAAANLARRVAESVPDRGALAVAARCSLDLVRGGRCSPDEPFREVEGAVSICCRSRHQALLFSRFRCGYGP